jgi:hypothetical protein
MLTISAILWLRIDATEELIPEAQVDPSPEIAVAAAG